MSTAFQLNSVRTNIFVPELRIENSRAEFKIQGNYVWPTNNGGKRLQYIDVLAVHDGQALCLIQKSRTRGLLQQYTRIYIRRRYYFSDRQTTVVGCTLHCTTTGRAFVCRPNPLCSSGSPQCTCAVRALPPLRIYSCSF